MSIRKEGEQSSRVGRGRVGLLFLPEKQLKSRHRMMGLRKPLYPLHHPAAKLRTHPGSGSFAVSAPRLLFHK